MTVRIGGSHHWRYLGHWYERKVKPGKWKILFKASKSQRKASGVARGSRYSWLIKARQDVFKTRRGRYQTRMSGVKYLLKAKPKFNKYGYKVRRFSKKFR